MTCSQLPNKQVGWNKQAGWSKFFVYYMKKCEQRGQKISLLHEKVRRGRQKVKNQ